MTAQGVSAYPAEVTAQMVANFAAGGAAINQLARTRADLRVTRFRSRSRPLTYGRAGHGRCRVSGGVAAGYDAVSRDADLVCLGEMGIGNTTAAAAMAAALFGGGGARGPAAAPASTIRASRASRR